MARSLKTRAWRKLTAEVASDLGIELHAINNNAHVESLGSVVKWLLLDNPSIALIEKEAADIRRAAAELDDYEHYDCHGNGTLQMANMITNLTAESYYGVYLRDIYVALVAICREIDRRATAEGMSYDDYAAKQLEVSR